MNILVVGAGFSGAVIARELAEEGHKVHVIESRDHVAGNAYDYVNEYGIRVHQYGPHLFHTSNQKVFSWLSKFTEWTPYRHKVKAQLDNGQYVTLPVNKETKEIVGEENVLDIFFRPYTRKMWDKELDDLNPDIVNRVPIRDDMNEDYFPNDEYQYMPKEGYTKLVENILSHENITVTLNQSYEHSDYDKYDHIFNSMPIDTYFDYQYGRLPYRSIKFNTVTLPQARVLPTTTVNFTHTGPNTRVTEWKNIPGHGTNEQVTTLTYEEPCDYADNNYERYYPVKDKDGVNRTLYKKYKELTPEKMTFIGRCGLYAYLDMHQAIHTAMTISEKFIKGCTK